jgi:hypothetical protein
MTVPLIVGVTGHRDLVADEVPQIREQVKRFFMELQSSFPELPLLLLSPLAAGADQLAAEVADELGIDTTVLLPMPAEEYRQDFSGPELDAFNLLLSRSPVIELPMLSEDPAEREEQYVALAAYMTAHCHILLAIWDGEDVDARGGTSSAIRFHQHETMSLLNDAESINPIDFIEDESDLVFYIHCSRRSADSRVPQQTGWLTRDDVTPRTRKMPERYKSVFNRMIEFNRDAAEIDLEGPSGLTKLPDDPDVADAHAGSIERLFQLSDLLAQQYQRTMFQALRIAYLLVGLAALSFIIYADLYSESLMIYLYVALVGAVLLVFKLEERMSWQRKYLDYRALAEALRVQFYWTLGGVQMRQRFQFAHDCFHERRDLELGWIRHVMRYAALEADNYLAQRSAEQTERVVDCWIRDPGQGQLPYYQRKALDSGSKTSRSKVIETASLLVMVALAAAIVSQSEGSLIKNLLIALAGFLPILAAIRQNFAHRTSERELAGQYHYFSRIFLNADQLLQRTESLHARREILRALGIAALEESGQWVLRQRERPVSSSAILG